MPLPISFLAVGLCVLLCATLTSCQREYSYEASPAVAEPKDTTPAKPFVPSCRYCNTATPLPDSSWQFNAEGAVLCGRAEKAIITLERKSFTFFGPSACSDDSGFVATVYLNEALDADKSSVAAGYCSVYYYDRVKPSHVFVSQPGVGITFIIDRYRHGTGEAEGRFSGQGFTESGEGKRLDGGRFRLRLR